MISHERSTQQTGRAALAIAVIGACLFAAACSADRASAPAAPVAASMARGGGGSGGGTGGVAISVIDLGTGDNGTAEAVNDKGQIVGTGGAGVGAFLWENGVLRQLGTLPGMTGSRAEDINESGQVVGYATNQSGGYQAFIWTAAGGMQPLGGSLGGCCTLARAINDNGVVVGEAGLPGTGAHTVVWENGVMRDVQSFTSGSTFPWDISNAGAVGQWNTSTAGFIWTAGGGMTILSGLDGEGDIPLGVNDLGQVVGWYKRTSADTPKAFLWTNGVITDLGTLGGSSSTAWAISNAGQVVGRADRPRKGTQTVHRAFLWTAATGMQDLGSVSGREWAQARDLNENGWVVGETYLSSGQSRATLWKLK
jgi:probable HAF family extracellular repeat protein